MTADRTAALPVVAALVLAGLALAGPGAVLPAVALAQVAGLLAWTVLTDAPNPRATVAIGAAAAVGTDVWALTREGHGVGAGAGLVGLAFLAAVVAELGRRERGRVGESLAVTVGGTVLAVLAATAVALAATRDGTSVAPRLLAVAAVALAMSRLPLPRSAADTAALAGGVAAGGLLGGGPLSPASGALVGLAIGAAVAVADRAVALAAADAVTRRARAAVSTVAVVVALAVTAPVAYVVSRLTLA